MKKILTQLKEKMSLNAEVFLGGSLAKGTNLDSTDMDVFIRFDYEEYKDKNISKELINWAKKHFKNISILHGSRDYVQVTIAKQLVELIPILNITDSAQAKNITDVSPLHVLYVNKKLKSTDSVKKLKKLLKANSLYGAESYIGGLSGYMCELLIIKYKSFDNFIKQVSNWEDKTIIDLEKYFDSDNKMKRTLGDKFNTPLVLIDPTQKDRNAANALSREKYSKLIHLCRNYLTSKTKLKFFKSQKFDIEKIKLLAKKNDFHLLLFKYRSLSGLEDVIGNKIIKGYKMIKRLLTDHDFMVYESGFDFQKEWANKQKQDGYLYFVVEQDELPKIKKHFGPKIYLKSACEQFEKKYDEVHVENEKLYTIKKRDITNLKSLKKQILSDKAIKSLFKQLK